MSKISPNFKRSEFACKCGCGFDTVDTELLTIAELVRARIDPYSPNSACRCKEYNERVGGGLNSQHLIGKAMDIPCSEPGLLYKYLDELYPGRLGLGLYNNFVHVDVRDSKARWEIK